MSAQCKIVYLTVLQHHLLTDKLIDNAGEYNGFLKIEPQARILSNPLKFKNGFLLISENWNLEIDRDKLEKYTINKEEIYK